MTEITLRIVLDASPAIEKLVSRLVDALTPTAVAIGQEPPAAAPTVVATSDASLERARSEARAVTVLPLVEPVNPARIDPRTLSYDPVTRDAISVQTDPDVRDRAVNAIEQKRVRDIRPGKMPTAQPRTMRTSPNPCVECGTTWQEPSRRGHMHARCPSCR